MIPDLIPRVSGTLTTIFYDIPSGSGETVCREIHDLVLCISRSGSDDGSCCKGKIYAFSDPDAFKTDGDVIDGKTVRVQYITAVGVKCTVNSVRLIRAGGVIHHAEIGVC